ncbi:MAG: S9 family peptidase [Candidatus Methanoperedens sp.]|nr:S9 family peptidase [Candidatus Methanoperedens sp.]CAG0977725.1 acylaminoacyl-peptidase [Methanosarcinales archaeon]
MTGQKVAPYGSWKSPITSDLVASGTIRVEQIVLEGENIYWIEMRPAEGGRYVVVQRSPEGQIADITPSTFNARTRVHEYGGGAFAVNHGKVYFSNFTDQRIYCRDQGGLPRPITIEGKRRYADIVVDRHRDRLICVCEDHTDARREAINSLISIDLHGNEKEKTLVSGNDFYSSPRLSPDGSRLAWLTWNHPNMPWDGTELWVGEIKTEGTLGHIERVAGGVSESVFQPEWSPDGILHFISDRTGWWNLYRWRKGHIEPISRMEVEFGAPQWFFGMSTYAFSSSDNIICTYNEKGTWKLASLDTVTQKLQPIKTPYTDITYLRAKHGQVVFVAGSPTETTSIVQLDLHSGRMKVLRRSTDTVIDTGYLSIPRALEFPTEHGLTAHAFFYPQKNQDYIAPPGERPPLLVISHGGPTSSVSNKLDLMIQYWTSRGFAVLNVNYGGSTGYGRPYRSRLNGQWGVVDVDDCINGAKHLVELGEVDASRLIIRGASAGGYTTLCALTFRDVFKAGADYYGVSDLEAMRKETHKFESQYLDRLIGPYPESRDLYKNRSPINFVENLFCPVIFFQGLEDKVVPHDQTEKMFNALSRKGLPVSYLLFEGEQHGIRRSENIKRALDAELYFYSKVFSFRLADQIEPVLIQNI